MMNSQENALEQGQLAEEQVAAEAAAEVQNVVEEAVAPAEEPAVEEAPAEEPAAEEAPAEEPAAEEAPAEEPVAEEAPAEEPVAEEAPAEEPAAEEEAEKKVYTTKQEVLDRVKEIAHSEENPQKDEVDLLKTVFYKLHIAEREQQLKEYIDGGGDPDNYVVRPDDLEEMFKAEMNVIKEKRAKVVWLRPVLFAAASVCALFISVVAYQSHSDQGVTAPTQTIVADNQMLMDDYFDEAADYVMLDNQDIYACLSSDY
jgi:hypothetical protein